MAEQFHRENHFVAKVYFKPWETANGKIWSYRILVPHANVPIWKEASKKGLAKHAHLYTQTAVGVESDAVERWFADEFESPAQQPLYRATHDQRLSRDDWKRIINFAAAQDVRTPAWFAQRMEQWDKSLPGLMKETMEQSLRRYEEAKRTGEPLVGVPRLPDAEREGLPLRTFVRRSPTGGGEIGAEIVIGRQYWLWAIKRSLTRNMRVLHQHHWTIVKPPEGTIWFTSDNPVIRLNYLGKNNYNFNGGWNSPGTRIYLPLGPQHLLYTCVGSRPPLRGQRSTVEQAEFVRRIVAEHASRMIFANAPDDEVPVLRPRTVDPAAVKHERDQWASWHEQQLAAEEGPPTETIVAT
jgi:hypothetical protein